MNSKTYRPEIDGLRAIAVLAVVLYHAGVGPVSGYAGVDMFFVISGYLITWLLVQEQRDDGRIDLLAFYARRVRRILPAAILVISSTVFLSYLLLPDTEQQQVYQSAISGLLFIANQFFLQHTGGYFDHPSVELPLIHLWSLSVEEQFYLIWPLILIALMRMKVKSVIVCGSVLALTSLGLAEYMINASPNTAFYLMPARFWELEAGALIALAPIQGHHYRFMAPVSLVLLITSLALPMHHFPGIGALPVVAGTALLLWMTHTGNRLDWVGTFLRLAPVNYIGRISYSLYLWHWPLLALYHATSINTTVENCLALCVLATLLAALTQRYVEMPCRMLPVAQFRGIFIMSGASATLCMALVIVACSRFSTPGISTATAAAPVVKEMDLATRTEQDQTPINYRCSISPVRPPDQLPDAACASKPGISPKVAIIGDSYGNSWQALAWAIGEKLGFSAINLSRSGCPIFLSNVDNGNPVGNAKCETFNANVVARVKGFDTILIAVRWDARTLQTNEAGISSTLAALAPTVRKIYLLGPSPTMQDRVPKCIRANQIDACAISRKEFEKTSAPMRAYLLSLTRQYKNVEYVAVNNFLCTRDSCPAIKDGIALYSDQRHVTYSTAKKFANEFVQTM